QNQAVRTRRFSWKTRSPVPSDDPESSKVRGSRDVGSPALSMTAAHRQFGTSDNPPENGDRCAVCRPWIIEIAGEPIYLRSLTSWIGRQSVGQPIRGLSATETPGQEVWFCRDGATCGKLFDG